LRREKMLKNIKVLLLIVILSSIALLAAFKGLDKAEENQIKVTKFIDTISEKAAQDNNVDLSNYHKVEDLFSSDNEDYVGLGSVYMDIAFEAGKGQKVKTEKSKKSELIEFEDVE
jgi:hypothetical protein